MVRPRVGLHSSPVSSPSLNKLGWLLLVLIVVLLPRVSVATVTGVADSVASEPGSAPASALGLSRDPAFMQRMRRRITTRALVRVDSPHGMFVGRVTGVQDSGLASLDPRDKPVWSGPRKLLSWDDVRTIEVRKRNPLYTAALGSVAGALLLGGIGYADFEAGGETSLGEVFLLGLVGAVYAAPVGFVVGIVVPIWEPLYRAPERRTTGEEVER